MNNVNKYAARITQEKRDIARMPHEKNIARMTREKRILKE